MPDERPSTGQRRQWFVQHGDGLDFSDVVEGWRSAGLVSAEDEEQWVRLGLNQELRNIVQSLRDPRRRQCRLFYSVEVEGQPQPVWRHRDHLSVDEAKKVYANLIRRRDQADAEAEALRTYFREERGLDIGD